MVATIDAQSQAEISTSPWYVAAHRGRDAINIQGFSKLRTGRRLISRSWDGFRLFEEPAYMVNFGYAHLHLPWEVWQVTPIRARGYEPMLHHEARQIRARGLQVERRMPPGFEFGPCGSNVRRLAEQLAQARHPPSDGRPPADYDVAMTFLEDHRRPGDWLHDARVSLAHTYLDVLTSGSAIGPFGRWRRHTPAKLPAHTLIDAAVAGLSIPDAVTRYWGLDQSGEASSATRRFEQ